MPIEHYVEVEIQDESKVQRTSYLNQIKLSQDNIEGFVYPSNIKNARKNNQTFRQVIQRVNDRTKIKLFQAKSPVNFPKGPNDPSTTKISAGFQAD